MCISIPPINATLDHAIQQKIDQKTKPIGALGQLEQVAKQIARIQQSLTPTLNKPHLLVFAGDHGIAESKVSAYPQEVTAQMVHNFLQGGAAINVFSQQHGLQFKLIDAGVNASLPAHPTLTDAKIDLGTRNFLTLTAMTTQQCQQAIQQGSDIMSRIIAKGCNVVGFGEMGIGNTAAASCLMASLCNLPIEDCVGRGTGLDDEGLHHKQAILSQAMQHHGLTKATAPLTVLSTFGGFEIAMMVGAMLKAASEGCTLIIDGFIVSAALLVAQAMQSNITDYCIFSHCGDESAHQALLTHLNAQPILNLGLRLGEGTGAALAYPLIKSAVLFLNEMATFDSAKVSQAS